ncbi:MAG: hypothetical protein IPK03_06055 [Bacteroidetes bacterium]|nr:hypothetical protein [Bacteroidota bacterium]
MSKFTIKTSSLLVADAQKRAEELFLQNLQEGSFDNGLMTLFIDHKPSNALVVFAGTGILEGKIIYLAGNKKIE